MTGLLFVVDGRPWTAGLGLRVGSACFVVGLRGCSKEDGIATVGWDCVVLARGRIACGRNKEDLLGGIAWLSQKTGNLGGNGIT